MHQPKNKKGCSRNGTSLRHIRDWLCGCEFSVRHVSNGSPATPTTARPTRQTKARPMISASIPISNEIGIPMRANPSNHKALIRNTRSGFVSLNAIAPPTANRPSAVGPVKCSVELLNVPLPVEQASRRCSRRERTTAVKINNFCVHFEFSRTLPWFDQLATAITSFHCQ